MTSQRTSTQQCSLCWTWLAHSRTWCLSLYSFFWKSHCLKHSGCFCSWPSSWTYLSPFPTNCLGSLIFLWFQACLTGPFHPWARQRPLKWILCSECIFRDRPQGKLSYPFARIQVSSVRKSFGSVPGSEQVPSCSIFRTKCIFRWVQPTVRRKSSFRCFSSGFPAPSWFWCIRIL